MGSAQGSRTVFCVVCSSADLSVGLFHSGGSFHIRGYEPILSLLLFVSALALHSRQLDLKLRLDFLWAVQVSLCVREALDVLIGFWFVCGGFIFIVCQLSVPWLVLA